MWQSFPLGPSLRQMANEAASRETDSPAFFLYPEEQDQGEHGELAKNCAKGAGPNHRIKSYMGVGGHAVPRLAHSLGSPAHG